MSSLVRLSGIRSRMYLAIDRLATDVQFRVVPSNMGLEFWGPLPRYASGDSLDQPVVGELKNGQRITWDFGRLVPTRYLGMVEVNPAVLKSGIVQAPKLVEPGEGVDMVVHFQATKSVDVLNLDWIIRVYLLD